MFQEIDKDDIKFVETYVREELHDRLLEKCMRLKIATDVSIKSNFFGLYAEFPSKFEFNDEEKELIYFLKAQSKYMNVKTLNAPQNAEITKKVDSTGDWFCNVIKPTKTMIAPKESQNLLEQMSISAIRNASRPKQGYRYNIHLKRLAVLNRLLSGPLGYKSLQSNLGGCLPSTSTTNRYIHRSSNAMVEGILRVDELKLYLQERNQPLWVSLSEDATRIDNRVQYDIHTNQLVGFVLPKDDRTGMPIPFSFKATSARDMLNHLRNETTAYNVNTVMAKPLGNSPPFCVLVFGSNNGYTAVDVSRRWDFITNKLKGAGIKVLTISSDSDPKYNSAMRKNSGLGSDSMPINGLFKCGVNTNPPFYTQDTPHVGTKLRNAFLKTIFNPEKLRFGNYFIRQSHVQEIFNEFRKDEHLLTQNVLNPKDKQNFESVMRLCNKRVIDLLKREVKDSEGTVMYLQIMSDVIAAFMEKELLPIERVERLWYSLFIVRLWRKFANDHPDLNRKDNCISHYSYYCIELNAHSMVYILLYLRENKLTHLFSPQMFSSQPCEEFYRYIRSLSSTCSTVTNCSMKEIMSRINRIQLMDEIRNDQDTGFVFPKSVKSTSDLKFNETEFPDQHEIMQMILKCKKRALEDSIKLGLIKKSEMTDDSICFSQVPRYTKKTKTYDEEGSIESEEEYNESFETGSEIDDLCTTLANSTLKNFVHKFENEVIEDTSPYVEVFRDEKRFVFKKTSVCWLFRNENQKPSSDRIYRVMVPSMKTRGRTPKIVQRKNIRARVNKRIQKRKP